MRAFGQHAVRILHSDAEVDRVGSPFRYEKARDGRDHAFENYSKFALNRVKKLGKFLEVFGAPRAQKLRALGQRALPNSHEIFKAFHHAMSALTSENARAWRPTGSRKLCAEIARKACKILGILARSGHKICVHTASIRFANRRTSLHLLNESKLHSNAKNFK